MTAGDQPPAAIIRTPRGSVLVVPAADLVLPVNAD